MSTKTDTGLSQEIIKQFEANSQFFINGAPNFVNQDKEKALNIFKEYGIPARKNEKYKYANIPKLMEQHLNNQILPKQMDINIDEVFQCDVSGLDAYNLMMMNGHYHDQPALTKLDNGVIYGSLKEAIQQYPELVQQHYGQHINYEQDGVLALNAIFARDGIFIYIPDGVVEEKPFQIVNIMLSDEDTTASYRNLIIAGKNSQANIIICDHTLSNQQFLSNDISEIEVGEEAHLYITKMQNEHARAAHFSHIFAHQQENSTYESHYLSLNGDYIRNNLDLSVDGENCTSNAYGLTIADHNQYVDNHIWIRHGEPNSNSTQLFKNILDGNAVATFNGRIYVAKEAQKTNAFQTNRNLLLSKKAKSNSKPQLEIYADDVKCSHGATSGKIDQEGLFYLRSRGIGYDEARHLLMFAFADEVVSQIKDEALRNRVKELAEQRLRGELERCQCCDLNCYQNA